MTHRYPHLAARIFNTPLLVYPQKLDAIIAGLGPRLLGLQGELTAVHIGAEAIAPGPEALAPELFSTRKGGRVQEAGWPGYKVIDGVAVVNANGALVHKSAFDMAACEMLLGYNDLATAIEHAVANADVHAVLIVWDSPGGEVQGAFEFADRLAALSGKTIYQIADGMAASAAYLGGSAKGKPYVTATGYAGSIGVVMRHVDYSGAIAKEGIAVEYIYAGAHKVDGHPFARLPADVRAEYQAQINTIFEMFVATVAKNTGISPEKIRGTEARTYMGQAAVDAGLAAGVTTTDALISELAGLRARSHPAGTSGTAQTTGGYMSDSKTAAGGGQQPANLTPADVDKARAEGHAAGKAEGVKEGAEQGAKAERERVSGILAHKEAEGRTTLAVKCVSTGLSVEQSGELLAAAPKTAAGANGFSAAMTALGNPAVKGGEPAGDADDLDTPQAINASWDKAFGTKSAKAA
jgi:signal peptide peptidase SppA